MTREYVNEATLLWFLLKNRIPYMSDKIKGTHAKICILDIASAFQEVAKEARNAALEEVINLIELKHFKTWKDDYNECFNDHKMGLWMGAKCILEDLRSLKEQV